MNLAWIVGYVTVTLSALLVFAAVAHIIYQKRSATSMSAWLLFILIAPPIAAPLYFIIGVRKRKGSKAQKSSIDFRIVETDEHRCHAIDPQVHPIGEMLHKNGIPSATTGNRFAMISDDIESYRAMMEAIESATQSIDIATFVFKKDATGKAILDALTYKARQGVRVRLLLDTMGSLGVFVRQRWVFRDFVEAGGQVAFFASPFQKLLQSYINLRNHRKIYLFDNRILLSGGMNISDDYMGSEPKARWRDLLYRLEGPTVAYFCAVFENDWAYANETPLQAPMHVACDTVGNEAVQAVPSGPDLQSDACYEALLDAFFNAKERIWIVTPYFVPDETLLQALSVAAHKGLDVRIITPKRSDNPFADLIRTSYVRRLICEGVKIYLYGDAMVHAKAVLVDRSGGMVGSLNFDNRSLFLNYEMVSFVYSQAFIEACEGWMDGLMQRCETTLEPPTKLRQALENIATIVAPMV